MSTIQSQLGANGFRFIDSNCLDVCTRDDLDREYAFQVRLPSANNESSQTADLEMLCRQICTDPWQSFIIVRDVDHVCYCFERNADAVEFRRRVGMNGGHTSGRQSRESCGLKDHRP